MRAAFAIAVGASLLTGACGRTDTAVSDTAQTTVGAATTDTGMAGMDHSTMAMPARDADQEFVRMMVDHHQGLINLVDAALARNPSEEVQSEAREMRQKQTAEQKRMIDMLKTEYAEDKMPMVMPGNAAMISEIASKSGRDLDRTFREKVIAHHEEALRMVTDYESRFTRPDVRSMAATMKAEQEKEISELRAELAKM